MQFRVPVTELREVQVTYLVEAEDADQAYDKAQQGDFLSRTEEVLSNEVVQRDPCKDTKDYEVENGIQYFRHCRE